MYLVAPSQNFNSDFAYFCITDMRFISVFVFKALAAAHQMYAAAHKPGAKA